MLLRDKKEYELASVILLEIIVNTGSMGDVSSPHLLFKLKPKKSPLYYNLLPRRKATQKAFIRNCTWNINYSFNFAHFETETNVSYSSALFCTKIDCWKRYPLSNQLLYSAVIERSLSTHRLSVTLFNS